MAKIGKKWQQRANASPHATSETKNIRNAELAQT